MAKKKSNQSEATTARVVRFSLIGFISFCASLVAGAGLLACWLAARGAGIVHRAEPISPDTDMSATVIPTNRGSWGELVTREITLNIPEEYAASETGTNEAPMWVFEGMPAAAAEELMRSSGLTAEQIQRALSARVAGSNATDTVIAPDRDLIFSLTPEVRSRFYTELARFPANRYMMFPFAYPHHSFEECMAESPLDEGLLEQVKQLVYPRGDAEIFSDYPTVLRMCNSDEQRRALAAALTRQVAVLARLRIQPDSNIAELARYWGRGRNPELLRPLLASLAKRPGGGTLSLLYLLPPFARERLYTFPTPTASDPMMDCHWTSFNFFNDVPENRFNNTAFAAARLESDYHEVSRPSELGDVLVFLNSRGDGIHSCVYIAADIVFTKNGNNSKMPWKLMHLSDLRALYARGNSDPAIKTYRSNKW
jgi:hypothetical protein